MAVGVILYFTVPIPRVSTSPQNGATIVNPLVGNGVEEKVLKGEPNEIFPLLLMYKLV